MKNVAVWGYGEYGRKLVQAIQSNWKDELRIVRIYDKKAGEMAGEDERLSDPKNIVGDFREGLFEAMMIGVSNTGIYYPIRNQLRRWDIPIFQLGKPEDFYPLEAFSPEEDPQLRIEQDGYSLFVLRDMRGTLSISTDVMYLFDASGKLLLDTWDPKWFGDKMYNRYDYPIRFDDPDLPTVSMPGEYCNLVLRFSGNYWHFTFESMDTVQLLEEAGFRGKYLIPRKPYVRELLHVYGIGDERILTALDFTPGTAYSFEKIYCPKLLERDKDSAVKVLKKLSDRMKEKLVLDPERYPSRLYVERAGTRKLLNGRHFAEKYGLTVIDPEKLSVFEQMNYFYNADLVLSAHGANSTNCIYMRKGTVFIETFGKRWVNYCNIQVLHDLGVFYLPVIQGPIMIGWGGVRPDDPFCDYSIQDINLDCTMEIAQRLLEKEEK